MRSSRLYRLGLVTCQLQSKLQLKAKIVTASRLKGFDAPTVWSEFTPLSNKHKSVNLGQGFPDWETPEFAKKALVEV